ncbi:uncharacterized protein LOC127760158 isoform X2 [Oryza glaberrima]|uniref:uncharacterized protein LOC127760158 isoform X2 n=1 Tax=Oryza glaberrima TaxID=4538 RepID=UPI00224C2093|nr:uncharacterized protein LOC127760158 isoform X2 [Oryza glaberrima]
MAAEAVGGGEQSMPEFWPEGSGILPMDERPPPPALRLPRGRRDGGLSGWLRSRSRREYQCFRIMTCLLFSSKQYYEIYLFGGIPVSWKYQEPMELLSQCMMKKSLWSILSTPLVVYFPQMRRVFHIARELRIQRPGSGLWWQDTRSAGGTWIRIRPSFSLDL